MGELLGANVFVYCQNNPVNFHDSNGFQMEEDFGGNTYLVQTPSKQSASNKPSVNLGSSPSGALAVAVSGALKTAEDHINDLPLGMTRTIGIRYTGKIKVPAVLGAETFGLAGKVAGVVGIFLSVNSMRDDIFNNNYTKTEKILRFGLDAGALILGGVFFASGGWVPLLGTAFTAVVVETGKNVIHKRLGNN